jgi:hypothetical protein
LVEAAKESHSSRTAHPHVGFMVERLQQICGRIKNDCDYPEVVELNEKVGAFLAELEEYCVPGDPDSYSRQNLDRMQLPAFHEFAGLFDAMNKLIALYEGPDPSISRKQYAHNHRKTLTGLQVIIESENATRNKQHMMSVEVLKILPDVAESMLAEKTKFKQYKKKLQDLIKSKFEDITVAEEHIKFFASLYEDDPSYLLFNQRLVARAIETKYREISRDIAHNNGSEQGGQLFLNLKLEYLQIVYAVFLYELKIYFLSCVRFRVLTERFGALMDKTPLPEASNRYRSFLHHFRALVSKQRGSIQANQLDNLMKEVTHLHTLMQSGFKMQGIIESVGARGLWNKSRGKVFCTSPNINKAFSNIYSQYREALIRVASRAKLEAYIGDL